MSCRVCGCYSTDKAHIKSKGSGGSNEESNLVELCRKHHAMQHSQGWKHMLTAYPQLARYLSRSGWYWEELNGSFRMYFDNCDSSVTLEKHEL